jgi:hypothetical protein
MKKSDIQPATHLPSNAAVPSNAVGLSNAAGLSNSGTVLRGLIPVVLALLASTPIVLTPQLVAAQSAPIVILEYPSFGSASSEGGGLNADNQFVSNPNFTTNHRVQPDETLSHIITEYYADSGLDLSIVQLAIVKKNKAAFVRGNPNFLYADKVLKLPSLNEMKNLVLGTKQQSGSQSGGSGLQEQIYFIGG